MQRARGNRVKYTMQNAGSFSAFSFRDFRLFLIGQIISLSGTWMQSVAQGWLVYSLTKSPLYLGVVAASGSLPILLFSLFGGIIADRYPKRNLLLITQALSVLPALSLGLLTSKGIVTAWHVAALAALLGTINALDVPVRQSFIAEMVGKGHIVNAIALNSAVFHGARIIGPMVAGLTIAYLGIPACFYLNALSFIAVIIALLRIQARGETRPRPEGLMKEVMHGMRFVIHSSEIRNVFILIAVFSVIGLPYISLLPVFAAEVFHKGPEGLGFLFGASGIGALIAALGIAARGDIRNKTRFMAMTGICFSSALLAFSISDAFWFSLLLLLAGGWGMVSYLAAANSFIQVTVPDELRGRVMSLYSIVFLGTIPIGNVLIGLIADQFGTPRAVTVSGMICLVAASLFARIYLVRRDRI